MGVTQDEITEVLHVAMTVGATRMQVMARAETAKLEPAPPEPSTASAPSTVDGQQQTPAAGAAGAETGAAGTAPSFQAAGVVAQAGGG